MPGNARLAVSFNPTEAGPGEGLPGFPSNPEQRLPSGPLRMLSSYSKITGQGAYSGFRSKLRHGAVALPKLRGVTVKDACKQGPKFAILESRFGSAAVWSVMTPGLINVNEGGAAAGSS